MLAPSTCCRLPLLVVRALTGRLLRLRCIYQMLLAAIVGLWIVLPLWQHLANTVYQQRRACYTHRSAANSTHLLDDILTATRQPTVDRSLFFVDATCRPDGRVRLDSRQACAIESAARAHPDWDVFVLFVSPVVDFQPDDDNDAVLSAVRGLPNVHWRTVNLWRYAGGTVLADWLDADEARLFDVADVAAQVARLVRYVSLHRYGGTVVALDVIVRRSLVELGENWAALDRDGHVHDAVLNMNRAAGWAEFALHEFRRRFGDSGATWNSGGVDALTQVVRTLCGGTGTAAAVAAGPSVGQCADRFQVLPSSAFYAVPVGEWTALFNARQAYYVSELTRDAYAVMLWSEWSGRTPLRRVRRAKEPVPVLFLAETHCAAVYAASGRFF